MVESGDEDLDDVPLTEQEVDTMVEEAQEEFGDDIEEVFDEMKKSHFNN